MGWVERQAEIQTLDSGAVLPLEGADLAAFVRIHSLAAVKELCEALDHVSWKTWTTNPPFLDQTQFIGELVDVLAFVGNLAAAVGCGTDELMDTLDFKQDDVTRRLKSKRYEQRRVGQ